MSNERIVIVGGGVYGVLATIVAMKSGYDAVFLNNNDASKYANLIKIEPDVVKFLSNLIGEHNVNLIKKKNLLRKLNITSNELHIKACDLGEILYNALNSLINTTSKQQSSNYICAEIINLDENALSKIYTHLSHGHSVIELVHNGQLKKISYKHIIDADDKIWTACKTIIEDKANYAVLIDDIKIKNSSIFKPYYGSLILEYKYPINNHNKNLVLNYPSAQELKLLGWIHKRRPYSKCIELENEVFISMEIPENLYGLPNNTAIEITFREKKLSMWVRLILRYYLNENSIFALEEKNSHEDDFITRLIEADRLPVNLIESNISVFDISTDKNNKYFLLGERLVVPNNYTGIAEEVGLRRLVALQRFLKSDENEKDCMEYKSFMETIRKKHHRIFDSIILELDNAEFYSYVINTAIEHSRLLRLEEIQINSTNSDKLQEYKHNLSSILQESDKIVLKYNEDPNYQIKLRANIQSIIDYANKIRLLSDENKSFVQRIIIPLNETSQRITKLTQFLEKNLKVMHDRNRKRDIIYNKLDKLSLTSIAYVSKNKIFNSESANYVISSNNAKAFCTNSFSKVINKLCNGVYAKLQKPKTLNEITKEIEEHLDNILHLALIYSEVEYYDKDIKLAVQLNILECIYKKLLVNEKIKDKVNEVLTKNQSEIVIECLLEYKALEYAIYQNNYEKLQAKLDYLHALSGLLTWRLIISLIDGDCENNYNSNLIYSQHMISNIKDIIQSDKNNSYSDTVLNWFVSGGFFDSFYLNHKKIPQMKFLQFVYDISQFTGPELRDYECNIQGLHVNGESSSETVFNDLIKRAVKIYMKSIKSRKN